MASSITISPLKTESATVRLLGTTALFCHRMSAKAKRQLMIGGRKKTVAERAEIKHEPRAEFIDSLHIMPELGNPYTAVFFPAMAIKSAMATAALVVPGIRKTDVQRLIFLPEEWVPIYGVPKLRMDITRSADIGKTPDVRTRAFFPEWATEVTVRYARPTLSQKDIVTLLLNAGVVSGIGDFRQEKGKGSFGTFEPMSKDFPEHLMDLNAQTEALQTPEPANAETRDLLAEFDAEVESRK